jgi:hypothetical protein
MTTKPVNPKFVDVENVKESLATGMTVVHPYAPGLIQIIFTTPRHDPQAVADRRFSEAVSFAMVARIIIPTSEVASLTELLNRQAAAEREVHARMANAPEGPARRLTSLDSLGS